MIEGLMIYINQNLSFPYHLLNIKSEMFIQNEPG